MAKMIKTKFYILLIILSFFTAYSQQKQVEASIDSTKIKIGSQFNLTIKTTVDTAVKVSFPQGRNFGLLEVLESYPIDTVKKGAMYELVKKYGLTQFDSGRYVIPPLPVIINNKNIRTDSLAIEVVPMAVDTIKQQMFDIKPVVAANTKSTWWIWVLALLAVLGAGTGILWYLKNRKPKLKEEEVLFSTPIEKATAQLKTLESKGLLEKGAVKDYYSELTDIARIYIEEAIHIPAMESTTGELIEAMRKAVMQKKMSLTQETFEQLEKVLRNADMVKFAKSKPMEFEIAEDRNRIEKTIVFIDKSIPEEIVEEEDHSIQKKELLLKKKKKKQRTIITIVAASLIVIITGGYFLGSYIMDVFGAPSKELLEGEWVTSEYGDPLIKLETPKVLTRFNEEKIQTNMPEHIKSFQKFVYGTLSNNFTILLSTSAFNKPTEVKAEDVINSELAYYEKNVGARNIVTNNEGFENEKGLSGNRSYGTMMIVNPVSKVEEKMYYSITVFSQPSGIQEVIVMHKDGDKDAEKIVERIMNSIEIAKVQ